MTQSSVQLSHILIIGNPEGADEILTPTENLGRVEHAATLDEGLSALRRDRFDAVICRPSDLTQVQGVHSTGRAAAIIDSVNEGICVVDEKGELEWANDKMLSFAQGIKDQVCQFCVETFQVAQADLRPAVGQVRGRRLNIRSENNEHFELTATPVIDLQNRVTHVAAVVTDVTNARRLQDTIHAIDRAGQELVSLDTQQLAKLDAQARLDVLERKILRCTKDILHFDNFHIRILNKKTNRLDPVLAFNMPPSAQETELYATPEGNGICGYVVARGRSYICPDVRNDPRYLQGIEQARSSLTVPLMLQDQVVGVANFESTKVAAFNEDDRQFAEIFARYIALALHILELLVSERYTTTGQLGRNVMAEITGPLNDILTDVESLVEDYIGHDDLRHRLRKISTNAITIRTTIKEMTSERAGVLGTKCAGNKPKDPLLADKRILVVDDEDIIRDTVRDVLTNVGCSVVTASDGIEAARLVQENRFDLVLSDIQMPGKNGYEVFAAAKQANPDTPVILTTGFGYDPNHSIVRARREGLSSVLFKPFKVDQLIAEIRTALQPAKA